MHMHGYPRDGRSRRASRSSGTGLTHHITLTGVSHRRGSTGNEPVEETTTNNKSSNAGTDEGPKMVKVDTTKACAKGRLERVLEKMFHNVKPNAGTEKVMYVVRTGSCRF